MFINGTFSTGGRARDERTQWRGKRIGDSVSIGSNATMLPVHICSGAVIGAGVIVIRNIGEIRIYADNPAPAGSTL